jgi:hypothetical protein
MSAYTPSLPRTAELRGVDRLLVLLGTFLADVGRRHAGRRAAHIAAAANRARANRRRDDYQDAVVERMRDNAAQVNPLGLR